MTPNQAIDFTAIEDLFRSHCEQEGSTNPHLHELRNLAADCDVVVELGTKHGRSASAFLAANCEVWSIDLVESARARRLEELAGGRFHFIVGDSRNVVIPECDLLFVDSLHTHAQVAAELEVHAGSVRRRLVFHDTITFGSVGADGETGQPSWFPMKTGDSVPPEHLGIRPAIDDLMIRDRSWSIAAHHVHSHGLLVLERSAAR